MKKEKTHKAGVFFIFNFLGSRYLEKKIFINITKFNEKQEKIIQILRILGIKWAARALFGSAALYFARNLFILLDFHQNIANFSDF